MFYRIIFLLSTLFLATALIAQIEEPLVTDRPDATESAVTVGDNTFQVETGLIYEVFESSTIDITETNYHVATTLIRYGLGSDFELRLHGKYQSSTIELLNSSKTYSGLNNLSVGMKYHFAESKDGTFNGSVLTSIFLPFGSEELSPSKVEPGILIALSQDLSDVISIGTNLGGIYASDDEEVLYLYSLAMGIGISEKLGAFVELFGGFQNSASPEHIFDGGFTYLINNYVQLDASAGKKVFYDDTNWLVNGGVSFRLR